VIFTNLFDVKHILNVFLKINLLLFRNTRVYSLFLLLLLYLFFSFFLELANGLKLFFSINMLIQKVDDSGLENRRVTWLENYSIYFVSQLQSPFSNSNAKYGENEILQLFIRPQLPFTNLVLCFTQLQLQKLSQRLTFIILFQIEILSSLLSILFDVLSGLIYRRIDFTRFSYINPLPHHCSKLWSELFVVVVDYFYLGKNLSSVKLIYFVGKDVSC